MKKVSVITINFNQPVVTEQLLMSINLSAFYSQLEIIVVDNGSSINPVPDWVIKYPAVRFIRSESNLGFAGGNNLGIEVASGDYYFLVNNDTEFTPGLVERLVKVHETQPNVGVVSPKIRYFYRPDIIQYVGFTPINYYTGRNKCRGEFEKDTGQYDNLTGQTGFAHGAAMMVKKEVVEKVGLMEVNFFLYYEEMDWCEKIRRAGYQIWVEPRALIYHKESMTVGKKSPLKEYFLTRNRILFIRKNASPFSIFIFFMFFLVFVTPRNIISYLVNRQYHLLSPLFKAIWWNFTQSQDSKYLGYPID